jgi:hypothetical protein
MNRLAFFKYLALLLLIITLSACSKKIRDTECPTGQMCTMIYATISVPCVDAAGNPVQVKDVTVYNQRTNAAIVSQDIVGTDAVPHHVVLATDGNKKQFSTAGDDVKVTATNMATNKTVTVTFKISGGCNCHVAKIAGPEKIIFN